jgi:hypothetical protein
MPDQKEKTAPEELIWPSDFQLVGGLLSSSLFLPVPVLPTEKNPIIHGWQNLGFEDLQKG